MKAYTLFEGTVQEQLQRIGRRLLKLENNSKKDIKAISDDVEAISDLIGDEDTADTILYRLKALEDAE